MWNITKSFMNQEDSDVLIKVDPVWGSVISLLLT